MYWDYANAQRLDSQNISNEFAFLCHVTLQHKVIKYYPNKT